MLYIDVKLGEKVKVGDNIEIQVAVIRPSNVRIGVTAPREIPVFRSELLDRYNGPNKTNKESESA